jgi:hypothetical protein
MMCNFQNFTHLVSTIRSSYQKNDLRFQSIAATGGGAMPWRSGGEAAGVELTDVGHTRSGGSDRRVGAEEDR